MLKKVIALSTAAMILLTPMSASAVTWEEVTDTLKSKNSYTDGKLTATRDGDTYTFTGGRIDNYVDINSEFVEKDGKFYFNGVQLGGMGIYADGGNYYVVLNKNTEASGFVYVRAEENGKIELVNEGTIDNGGYTGLTLLGNSHITNKGTLKAGEGTYYPIQDSQKQEKNIPNISGYAENVAASGTQAEAEKLVDRMYTFDVPGTYNVIVTLYWEDENEEFHYKDFIVTRTVGEDEGPSEEEIRHDMEMKRQAEAIGGVYGSPYWIKQLYLGYHSYNLRLLIDGQPVTMRERLNWNADKSKGISLRVNTVAPEKLTMRFDEKVLEVFERTNITTVTLLDKNGAAVMQYNVSDLRAAYDQYGLNDADQLVVGGVDDDVMKIGADGQLVPVE